MKRQCRFLQMESMSSFNPDAGAGKPTLKNFDPAL